jgi:DNA polymerase
MSWFDDAPTPEYKPQRKKTAAEAEQSSSTQPARAAPSARAASPRPAPHQSRAMPAPPPAMPDEAPAYDDIPMDQPPAWFDDELPAASPAARSTEPAAGRAPAPGRTTDEEIAAMDWPALQAAIATCTRCARCETRRQAIPTWLALDTAPGLAEDSDGYQFAGDPGYLLDNMLKAVGQTTEKGAYLTSLVKCHAPHPPSAEELQACRPYLERELALTQAKVIVTFGHSAGKGLLGAAARGRIMQHGSVPVVATYHPADLLKKPEEKAKAWQDLCLAKAAHAGRR